MLTLIDVDAAVAELRRVLDLDARIVCIKGGPAHTPTGLTSPADPRFDPFWALANEAGVAVGIHSGDAGYGRYLADWEPHARDGGFPALAAPDGPQLLIARRTRPWRPWCARGSSTASPASGWPASSPGPRGCPHCSRSSSKAYGQMPSAFASDPVETFRTHVWVAPFYEDDLGVLKDDLGARPPALRLGLAARRGAGRAQSFAQDLRRFDYQRRRDSHRHGRQRLAAHPAALNAIGSGDPGPGTPRVPEQTRHGLRRHTRGGGVPRRGPGLAGGQRRQAPPERRARVAACCPTRSDRSATSRAAGAGNAPSTTAGGPA